MTKKYKRFEPESMFPIPMSDAQAHYLLDKHDKHKVSQELDNRDNTRVSFHGYVYQDGRCTVGMYVNRDCGFMSSSGTVLSITLQDTDGEIEKTARTYEQRRLVKEALHNEEVNRIKSREKSIHKQMFG